MIRLTRLALTLTVPATAVVLLMLTGIGEAMACACCGTYRVQNVESWDVLNVRSGPHHTRPKVGELDHDESCIRIIGDCQADWCEIANVSDEVRGWVNTRYLKLIE